MTIIYKEIEDVFPELDYKEPIIPEKSCINCKHSYCHNPGAYITGLSCKLIELKLRKNKFKTYFDEKDKLFCYSSVVNNLAICNKYKGKKNK